MSGAGAGLTGELAHTQLARGVTGVTSITLGAGDLERWPYWKIIEKQMDGARGRPIAYAAIDNRLYWYPHPDRNYRINVMWDGKSEYRAPILSLPHGWYSMYETALAEAKRAANL